MSTCYLKPLLVILNLFRLLGEFARVREFQTRLSVEVVNQTAVQGLP